MITSDLYKEISSHNPTITFFGNPVQRCPSSRWTDVWFVSSLKPNSSRENPDATYCVQWCGTPIRVFGGKLLKTHRWTVGTPEMEVWFRLLSSKSQYSSIVVRVWTCKLWSNHLNHTIHKTPGHVPPSAGLGNPSLAQFSCKCAFWQHDTEGACRNGKTKSRNPWGVLH